MMPRRVYVLGVGAVTALGSSWPLSVQALARGQSAVGPVQRFDAQGFPCTVAAEIPNAPVVDDLRWVWVHSAAQQACADAGWPMAQEQPAKRVGVFLGAESGRAPMATLHALTRAAGGGVAFNHEPFGRLSRDLVARFDASVISPAAVTSRLAGLWQASGPAVTISLACASGASAIAEAARAIRLGLCDAALCGGVGADVDPLMLAGFGRLGALSAKGVSCPFDVRRDGFVVGEGAAMVLLSHERGDATVELAGEGRTLDAHHLTAPDPDGLGAERAMRLALSAAGMGTVDVVQAHGTSTPLNDAIEASALRRVLGPSLDHALVSSAKGALGHWIAGAGALGFLCAHEAVANGSVLPTAHLTRPDPACALPHVMGQATSRTVHAAMVNAFAFGGANCCLVLRRFA
ncbi:MAG: beta-ketoacyl-[acyl-carrier-protein] synthase family protein [Pseudomonadota bacterium]